MDPVVWHCSAVDPRLGVQIFVIFFLDMVDDWLPTANVNKTTITGLNQAKSENKSLLIWDPCGNYCAIRVS